ncbi:MAG: hypothetical protein ACWA5U_02190 [bacterium]
MHNKKVYGYFLPILHQLFPIHLVSYRLLSCRYFQSIQQSRPLSSQRLRLVYWQAVLLLVMTLLSAPLWAFSNGSFESPSIPSGRWDKNSEEIPTWESNAPIEFYKSGVYNTEAVEGSQFIDLASPDNELNFVQQTIITTPNQAIDIAFHGKAGIIRVSANEEPIGVFESSDQQWQKHHIRYTPTSTETRLRFFAYTFDAFGTKTGNFLDAITVIPVSVPEVMTDNSSNNNDNSNDSATNNDTIDSLTDNNTNDTTDTTVNDNTELAETGNQLDEASGDAADFIAPALESIVRYNPLTEKTNVSSVVMRVSFSEAVFNIDETDFQLQQTGSLNGRIIRVTQMDQKTYDVTIDNLTGTGSLTIGVTNMHDIVDLAGNPLLLR